MIEMESVKPAPGIDTKRVLEKDYRVELPEQYIAILQKGNGGVPKMRRFRVDGTELSIDFFLPVFDEGETSRHLDRWQVGVIESKYAELLGEDPDRVGCELLPFALVVGDDLLCLDYRAQP